MPFAVGRRSRQCGFPEMCCRAFVGADRRLRLHGPKRELVLVARGQGLARRVAPDGGADRSGALGSAQAMRRAFAACRRSRQCGFLGMCCRAFVGADRRLRLHGAKHRLVLVARRQGLARRVAPDGGADRSGALGSAQAMRRALLRAGARASAAFSACAVVRSLAQLGGFDSAALSTDSFWSHAGKASPAEWRVTKLRVAWAVQHNPAATASDGFWALMSQNLSTPQFGFIAKRVVATVTSRHGSASLAMGGYWAKLGEHMPNAEWDDGFAAFLQMSTSAANENFFWARFRSPNWPAAIRGMRATMVDVIRACKSNNKPVGISRAVFKAHATANPTQIALSPAPAGPSIPRCECADMPCSCNGPWLVE